MTPAIRSGPCTARSSRTGEPCKLTAVRGATVCQVHGGRAPQVRAAAARRVTLAEAMASEDRRHPLEVLASALHGADVLSRQVQQQLAAGNPVTSDMVQALLDSLKTQAGMAKLVLDTGGPEQWSAQEAVRQQGEALVKICREMARLLGHDPSSPYVQAALDEAVASVVRGKRARRAAQAQVRAIEGEVVQP